MFKIAAAQTSSVSGDVDANVTNHCRIVEWAAEHGVDMLVFPELSLTGYEPEFAERCAIADPDNVDINSIAQSLAPLQQVSQRFHISVMVGCPIRRDGQKPFLGSIIFQPNRIDCYRKRFLHSDEKDYFSESDDVVVIGLKEQRIGLAICADIHQPSQIGDLVKKGISIYAASVAITPGGIDRAIEEMGEHAGRNQVLSLMSNYSEATGDFPIAGSSAIWDPSGSLLARAPEYGEALVIATFDGKNWKADCHLAAGIGESA